MAVKWTEAQKKVITLRDRNILVSAAAGSGKTAVLVQRILSKIMDPLKPVDIDRLLIMTFTRAAAGEMRERIERGLDQALAEDPDNEHLQRQMTLIHTAQITTIDGFCAYVIRNYFHLIGLDPGYRTADEGELKLLQEDVLKELFEDHYAERKADFTAFVESYAPGKTDEGLKEHVLELYNAAMSNPWPEKWLDSCVENYHLDPEKGLEGTRWFRYLWEAADCALKEAEELTETAMKTCQLQDGPELYLEALEKGLPNLLQHVSNITTVYKLPCVVAINRFPTDTEAELKLIETKCKELGVNVALSEVWGKGGEGGVELAKEVIRLCEQPNDFTFSYELNCSIKEKIEAIAKKIYHADGVNFTANAEKQIKTLTELGYDHMPICMAKTQYSFTDDQTKLGAPRDFTITVRNVKVSAGAGFLVALTGEIMTMPGLPKVPAAERIDVDETGKISGLF